MTNEQKYKTADERVKAFHEFCNGKNCDTCKLFHECTSLDIKNFALWLALPYENEKPEPCPFCHSETEIVSSNGVYQVSCVHCLYLSEGYTNESAAISAHNRVARAVMAAKKGVTK